MAVKIISNNDTTIKIEIDISISKSMLKTEDNILNALNECGNIATVEALAKFDTDGTPIKIGKDRYTSKGQVRKKYQTPYGEVNVERHVYQNSRGGKVFCPLERDARTIKGTTPRFAKQIASKYSDLGSSRVQKDLSGNHNRNISREYIRKISESVGSLVEKKSVKWNYCPPIDSKHVNSIGVSLDGTCMYLSNDGWRLAMVGAIALYDNEGERLHTQYIAAPPEYGKTGFLEAFTLDIEKTTKLYPSAIRAGIADGAADNWVFLEKHTSFQILDFFHASEYLNGVAKVVFRKKEKQKSWFSKACHTLKHEKGGAAGLLGEMQIHQEKKYSKKNKETIKSAITYFRNHIHQMDYSEYAKQNLPIGSGVIEAACKVIVKQRMCNSGMKWNSNGAKSVLNLRCVNYSGNQWGQLWNKIDRYGV